MSTTYRRRINIEKSVAKLYLYSFPFLMIVPLSFLESIFVGIGGRASFLFLLIGLLLVLVRGKVSIVRDESSKLFNLFISMFIVGDLTSIVMAIILYKELGTIGGENTFDAVIPKILFSIAYFFIVYYNRELFRLLSKEDIQKVFDRLTTICIIISLWQICVLYFGGAFTRLYDLVNTFFGAWSSTSIVRVKRIALFLSEPASMGGLLGIIAFPFVLSKWIYGLVKSRDIVKFVLLIFVLYYTKSTTGYFLFILDFLVFGYLFIRNSNVRIVTKAIIIALMLMMIFALGYFIILNITISDNIIMVFDKLFNSDNASSLSRKVGLYVNWGVFKEYPIVGVGNGNQGFFYQKYFPQVAESSQFAVADYKRASSVLFDGGTFFPSFASGYGILGVSLLILFAYRCAKVIRSNKDVFGYLYYFYLISSIALVFTGFSSTLISSYYCWFVISLPLAVRYWKNDVNLVDTNNTSL